MIYKLRDMSWTEFDERRKTAKTIILPSGACEVYGPQNPMGADILVAKKLSELLAAKVNGIVGPCLEVGQSKTLCSHPGTIAVSSETLRKVYGEIIENFVRLGFKNFFIVNNHLHNTIPLTETLEDAKWKFGINYGMVGVWQYLPVVTDHLGIWETPAPHAHASEAQTSVLLALVPELVDMSKAVNSPIPPTKFPGIVNDTRYVELTASGILGDGTVATKEKGEKAVEVAVEAMAAYIKDMESRA
jgi:creatinine amidohydrolase